jgi:hypothetical protein
VCGFAQTETLILNIGLALIFGIQRSLFDLVIQSEYLMGIVDLSVRANHAGTEAKN